MDVVFYFHFHEYYPKNTTRSLAFYAANIPTTWDKLDGRICCWERKIETQYGEHRRSVVLTSAATGVKIIGYSSSDIHGERCHEVMNLWRDTFLKNANTCVVSNVYDVTNIREVPELFHYVKDAHAHQQAQQLRDTLNATITTCASPATVKKI